MTAKTSLNKQPVGRAKKAEAKRKQTIATVATLLSLLGGAATYNFHISPTQKSMEESRQRIQTLDSQIQQAMSVRDRLPQLRAENTKLKADLKRFERSFPKEEDLPQLLLILEELARSHNVKLGAFSRTASIQKDTNVKQVALSTTAEGAFPNLYNFMKDLGNQQRYLSIEKPDLSIKAQGEMSTNLTVNAFVLMKNATGIPGMPGMPGAPGTASSSSTTSIPTESGPAGMAADNVKAQERARDAAMESTK